MVRSLTKRGMPKPFAILIAALLALYFVPFVAAPASAATVGGFEIEGNLVDDSAGDPPIDWNTVDTSSSAFATDVDNVDQTGKDTTTFKGASKEYNLQNEAGGWPGWEFGSGNATGKSDFGRWATYTNTDASNHVWFFLGFDRGFGTGTAKYAFELNQVIQNPTTQANPTRSQGDIRLIVWDQGNGVITLTGDAQNTDVGLYKWADPDQGPGGVAEDTDNNGAWVKNTTTGIFEGASNTGETPVSVPSWWTSGNLDANGELAKDTFLEFGMDLTSFGAVLGCPSSGFSAANARSITGTGGPGTLVDYLKALPVHIPSTCTSLVTDATDQVTIGNSITDTATITPAAATGTVTFQLYGPNDANCVNNPVATLGPITVVNGTASSGPYTPTATGTYRWIASYTSNDTAHFADTAGECNDANEQSVVVKTQPKISTDAEATDDLLPGTSVRDTATVTGLSPNAGGTVTFRLYSDNTCDTLVTTLGPVAIGTVTGGTAKATSPNYTDLAKAGTYWFIASYSGDANNEAAAGHCGDDDEDVTIRRAGPAISTVAEADDDRLPGTSVNDTATVTGLTPDAGGTVTFHLYSDNTCDTLVTTLGPVAIGTVTSGTATAESPDYTGLTKAGTYYFVASYSGDANNDDVSGHCGDAYESVEIKKANPEIDTEVPASVITLGPDGSDLTDTAELSGGTTNPKITGEITFRLYGPFDTAPGDESCTPETLFDGGVGDHNPQEVDVSGNGEYTTPDAVHVTEAGFYTWVASYDGDDNNHSATHECGDEDETVEVQPRQPEVTTVASATDLVIGDQGSVAFSDQAMLSEATNDAGGTFTFRLFGPGATVEAACATTGAVQGSPVTVDGNGTYQGPTVSVSAAGYYSWVATYSGDDNNVTATHPCGQPAETVHVFSGSHPTLTKIANPPSGSTVQPGDLITYSVTVGNTGDVAIDDGVVKDTLPGYVTVDQASVTASGGTFTAGGVPTTSAGTIVWTVDLAPGATKTFTYKVTVDFAAPDLTTLVNLAEFFNLKASTTHRTPAGNLTIVKEVSPVAGGGVVVSFGDTLTYTLTATASGQENQPNAVVTDYLPGFDPARPGSGKTTYVPGSAACIGAGTCTVTGPDAKGLITWSLGNMAAGTSRQVTFKVKIDDVAGSPGETIAVDILNAGAVKSDRTPLTPSNEVVTPVTKVLPVKIPRELPKTGTTLPIGPVVGTAIVMLVLGLLLATIGRRRTGVHRR